MMAGESKKDQRGTVSVIDCLDTHFLDQLQCPYQLDAPLGAMTWFGTGGNAQVLAKPQSVEQLSALIKHCYQQQIPVKILGSGANLLISDQGVKGIVLKLDAPAFTQVQIQDELVTAGSGYDLFKLVTLTTKAGLSGLERLAGIPASLGGAVRMNAGGAYGDIGQVIQSVKLIDASGEVYQRDRSDLVFAYRKTNIVAKAILQVTFKLEQADPNELSKRVREIFLYKKTTQPMSQHSAGCAFKNPKPQGQAKRVSAGMLIDQAGLKGYAIGSAKVSERHANFIVANPGATSTDIADLINEIQAVVKKHHDIQLKPEVVIW